MTSPIRWATWPVATPGRRDWALAIAVALVGALVALGSADDARLVHPIAAALAVVGGLTIGFRRTRTVEALMVAAVAAAASAALGMDNPAWFAVLVLIFSAASRRPRDEAIRLAGISIGVGVVGILIGDWREVGGIIFLAATGTAAWAIGGQVRLRRQRAEDRREATEAEARERELRAEQQVAEERIRIARELHDVVAHSVSVMVVQAGAARTVLSAEPRQAEKAMLAVEETGRGALNEMRRLLGVLRTGEAGRLPQPSLDDVEHLVAQSREAGLDVTLEVRGVPAPAPETASVSAYRIVQEGLTNVRRHAGPGAVATVTLGYAPERLEVLVRDDGAGGAPTAGDGHGIVGMRERAAMLGGELGAGPRPEGGWEVRATIPLTEPEDQR